MRQMGKSAAGIATTLLAASALFGVESVGGQPTEYPPPATRPRPTRAEMERRIAEQKARAAAANTPEAKQTAEAARRQAEAARSAKFDEEDRQFAAAFNASARWRALPPFVRNVIVAPTGRAYFTTNELQEEPELRKTVERAAGGGLPLIRGGRLQLVDGQGRFWVTTFNAPELRCFDGKRWSDEVRLASGEDKVPEALRHRGSAERGRWEDGGWEDAAGNLYFIGGASTRTGRAIHRRAPDGKWTLHKFIEPRKNDDPLQGRPLMAEQAGGRVAFYPEVRSSGLESTARVIVFDGTRMDVVDPRVCKNDDHSITCIMPMPDGSVASICSGDRLWFRWPDKNAEAGEVAKLVAKLEHADPQAREDAADALVRLGAPVVEQLRAIPPDDVSPEARIRLDVVITTIDLAREGDVAERPEDDQMLYRGRYRFDNASLVSQRSGGTLTLFLEECFDARHDVTHRDVLVTIDPAGKWTVRPVPIEQWDRLGAPRPDHRFVDAKGGIWLRQEFRAHPADLSASPIAPEGLVFDRVIAEDEAGRVYVEDDRYRVYVYDPSQPPAPGDLKVERHVARGAVALPGEGVAWAVKDDVWPHELLRLGGASGKVEQVPRDWGDDQGVGSILPLKGAVLAAIAVDDPEHKAVENPFRLWDGVKWTRYETLETLVEAEAPRLAKTTVPHFQAVSAYGERVDGGWFRIGSDGAGGLWFWRRETSEGGPEREPRNIHELRHFDGKEWRDVWASIGIENPLAHHARPIALSAKGRDVAMLDEMERTLYLVRRAGDGFKRVVLSKYPHMGMFAPTPVETRDGALWFRPWEPNKMCVLRGDAVADVPDAKNPMLGDGAGNLWAQHFRTEAVRVKVGERWIDTPFLGKAMAQSPDGRVWLMHVDGLSHLKLDAAAGTVTEVKRYQWGGPRNDFYGVFFDDANGLWMRGSGNRLVRYALPPAE